MALKSSELSTTAFPLGSFFRLLRGFRLLLSLNELVDSSSGIQKLLLPGVERMTSTAYFNAQCLLSGP